MSLDCSNLHTFVVTSVICGLLVLAQGIKGEADPEVSVYIAKNPFQPTFLPTPGNVTFNKGDEAVMKCAVEHRGTRTIVWRRASDPNPITIGPKTYIGDTRFRVVHHTNSLEWNLHIKDVQPRDAGVYECQVSAVERNIRQLVMLTVEENNEYKSFTPEIEIRGSFFVERGDTLKLVCNATGNEYPPDEIDWFKDGNKIKNSERITLSKVVSLSERKIISSLYIRRGHMNDAGTYICRTSDLQVTSVKINVLNTGTNNEKRESQDISSSSVTRNEEMNEVRNSGHVLTPGSHRLLIVLALLWFTIHWSRCVGRRVVL